MPMLGDFEWHGEERNTGRARMAGKRVRSPMCPEACVSDERPAKRRQSFARVRTGTIRPTESAIEPSEPAAPTVCHGMAWVPRVDQTSPEAAGFAVVTPAPAQISGTSPSALTTPRRQLVFSGATFSGAGRSGSRPVQPFRRARGRGVPPPCVAFAPDAGKPVVCGGRRTKSVVHDKPAQGYSAKARSASQRPPAPAPRATRSISQPRTVQTQSEAKEPRPARQERKSKSASSRSISAPAPPRGQCPPPQLAASAAENPPPKVPGRRASGSAAQPRRTVSCSGRDGSADKARAPLAPLETSRLQNGQLLAQLQDKKYIEQQETQEKRRAQLVEARMKAARESRQKAVAMRGSGILRPTHDGNSSVATVESDKPPNPKARWVR